MKCLKRKSEKEKTENKKRILTILMSLIDFSSVITKNKIKNEQEEKKGTMFSV